MNDLTLGQKIRNFRKRAGMSQLELELAIGASPGSISRIENGKVNPTKETVSKIANSLDLRANEAAELLDLETFSPEEILIAVNNFSDSTDIDQILKRAVDLMYDLFKHHNGAVIFLIDRTDNKLYAKSISSKIPNINIFLNMLPSKFQKIGVELNTGSESLFIKTVENLEIYQSIILKEFTKDYVSDRLASAGEKLTGYKSGITIPLVYNHKVEGCLFFMKKVKEKFTEEKIRILKLLANQIIIAIKNAEKFRELEEKYKAKYERLS